MANRKADKALDSVALWVAVLERGRLTRDFNLIRQANAELERLRVRITIGTESYGQACDVEGRRP